MTDQPILRDLIADVETRLRATAKSKVPPAPTKKQLEAVDPSVRAAVRDGAKDLRAGRARQNAIAESVAGQASDLADTIVADFQRLALLGAGQRPVS